MIRLIGKQTDPILKNLKKGRTPYQVRLIGFMLKYLIENDLEYSKDNKDEIYDYFKKKDNLEDKIINEIRETTEGIIEESYVKDSLIRKLNYDINKDDIQEEFYHKLKENVMKDIIAESN